jgi:membrane protein
VKDFLDDECMVSGAALAYYTIFSLPPLLVLIFYVAGLFGISQDRINRIASRQLGLPTASMQPSASAEGAQDQEASQQEAGAQGEGGGSLQDVARRSADTSGPISGLGPISKAIGIGILIFSATGLFAQLQYSLNRAWEVGPDPEQGGIRNFLGKRLLSLGMILVIAFLLLVSLVLSAMVEEILQYIQGQSPDTVSTTIAVTLNNLVTFILGILLFAAMFKTLPDADMQWRDLWVGAAITSLLFVIGKALIGWYLQSSQLGASWGNAATSLIAALVWVYYSSLIVLLGAEITQAWVNQHGRGMKPSAGAVRVVKEKKHLRESAAQQPQSAAGH